jgi:transposase
MEQRQFYAKLLKVQAPWFVERVSYDEKLERIDVYLAHHKGEKFSCAGCGEKSSVYDHEEEKIWRHLNTCQAQTFIHARPPRTKCGKCGVRQAAAPWAEPGSGHTMMCERWLIDLERECSIEAVCRLVNVEWHEAWGVMEKAVARGMARKERRIPEHLGVDEKSFAKGHKYETIITDIAKGTVEYVVDDRTEESLKKYYKKFTRKERSGVKALAMDMWVPYIKATMECVPDAEKKIVFDKFHVVKYITEAVDKVRKEENKELCKREIYDLKNTKYLWLRNEENIPQSRQEEFEKLKGKDLKVSRAWAIKENFRTFWMCHDKEEAKWYFTHWYFWATHSRLKPVIKAAKTLNKHIDNILTWFDHHISNAVAEGINGKIEKIKNIACGFRNREHYKTAIYFHCSGLDMYPRNA